LGEARVHGSMPPELAMPAGPGLHTGSFHAKAKRLQWNLDQDAILSDRILI
jgi:hypothetical protein